MVSYSDIKKGFEDLDDASDDEMDDAIDTKFGFTDSYKLYQLLKMMLFIQILALIIDNPSYSIICEGILYYALHFY